MTHFTQKKELAKLSVLLPTMEDQMEKFAPAVQAAVQRSEEISPQFANAQPVKRAANVAAPTPFDNHPAPNGTR